jgi:hypothetical protein
MPFRAASPGRLTACQPFTGMSSCCHLSRAASQSAGQIQLPPAAATLSK